MNKSFISNQNLIPTKKIILFWPSRFISNEPKKLERTTAENRRVHSHNAPILISMCVPFSFFLLFFRREKRKYPLLAKIQDRVEYWLHIRRVYSRSTLLAGAHAAAAMTPGIRPLSHFTPFRPIKVTRSFFVHVIPTRLRNSYDSWKRKRLKFLRRKEPNRV